MKVVRVSAALAVLVGLMPAAWASPIFVANPSFEAPATQGQNITNSWAQIGAFPAPSADAYNPYQFEGGNAFYTGANPTTDPANGGRGYPGIAGENLAFVFEGNPGTGLSQTLTTVMQGHTKYTLTVAEGNRNGTTADGFLGSQILLLAGGTVVAASTDNVGPAAGTFRDQVAVLADSSSFPGLIGQPLTIELLTTQPTSFFDPTVGPATDWDNVRLDALPLPALGAGVPEPSILALFGLGAAALAAWRRRRYGTAFAPTHSRE